MKACERTQTRAKCSEIIGSVTLQLEVTPGSSLQHFGQNPVGVFNEMPAVRYELQFKHFLALNVDPVLELSSNSHLHVESQVLLYDHIKHVFETHSLQIALGARHYSKFIMRSLHFIQVYLDLSYLA